MATDTTPAEAETVGHTVNAPSRTRGLRPAWRPGQSGNPKGRPSHRKLFEEALARAVTGHAEAIVGALVRPGPSKATGA